VIDRVVLHDQKAQTMAEYAVILGVIMFGVIATVSLLSDAVLALFQRVLDTVSAFA
jgi:Flp pilus assembly pilin Flp